MEFFSTSSKNLVAAAQSAGVGHYVALSIVNCDGLPESGYMRAKVIQERTITGSGLPYTIVRATQFQEFAEAITESLVVDGDVRVPDGRIQLIAAADVSSEVARVAQDAPVNGIVDIGGPEKMSFADMARAVLAHQGRDEPVVIDPQATYFGTPVDESSLVTGEGVVIATTRFADWLAAR